MAKKSARRGSGKISMVAAKIGVSASYRGAGRGAQWLAIAVKN